MHIKLIHDTCLEILPLLFGVAKTASKNLDDKTSSDFIVISTNGNIVTFNVRTTSESLEIDIEAEVIEQGSALVPIVKFVTIVSNTKADTISIRTVDLASGSVALRITGTGFTASVPTKFLEFLPPEWKAPDLEIPIPVEILRALLQRVRKALVKDSSPGFQSIRLVFKPSQVWAVAASNHKIAGASWKSDTIINRVDALVPVMFLPSFDQVLSKLDGEIMLGVSSSKLSISAEGIRYSTLAAIEGPPNVAQLFRVDGLNSLVVDSAELLSATKLVSASVSDDGYAAVTFMRDGVKISGSTDGSVATKIAVSDVQTDCELTQGFRLSYLADCIGKSKKVRIFFGRTAMERTIWEYVDDEFTARCVLAPARIN